MGDPAERRALPAKMAAAIKFISRSDLRFCRIVGISSATAYNEPQLTHRASTSAVIHAGWHPFATNVPDLGSGGATRGGSSPSSSTEELGSAVLPQLGLFFFE